MAWVDIRIRVLVDRNSRSGMRNKDGTYTILYAAVRHSVLYHFSYIYQLEKYLSHFIKEEII